ncbi:MAG: AmmeMemoRadiSam system protein B [Caldisericia bacterium]
MERVAYVAGKFYPADPEELRGSITGFLGEPGREVSIPGIIVPHAGIMYSGKTAGAVIGKIKVPDTVVIFGPNHTGFGTAISVYPGGNWNTPLGSVEVDSSLAKEITKNSEYAELDEKAHISEHSIEVLLPFLQVKNKNLKIVPIAIGTSNIDVVVDVADAIDKSTDDREILFVASSDFTHYEPEYTAKARDKVAINSLKELDWEKFIQISVDKEMSICGVIPIAIVTELSKKRGDIRKTSCLFKFWRNES